MKHIEAFQRKIEKEMPNLLKAEQSLTRHLGADKAHKYYLLTVKFGIQTYRAYLEWCKEAKEILEKSGE